ncbi:hypothetical protein WJX72_001335 [[Myrmecia] bisecta]|uniref:TMC domain-containing protein n=1 Tax=[Myrmecia] bisecta TaxID=41462 RepID=A0AAW1Q6K0_9CHLO
MVERYPLTGEGRCFKRQDMRKGHHVGRLLKTAHGELCLEYTWSNPSGGRGLDIFRPVDGELLHVETRLWIDGKSVEYTQVYHKSHDDSRGLSTAKGDTAPPVQKTPGGQTCDQQAPVHGFGAGSPQNTPKQGPTEAAGTGPVAASPVSQIQSWPSYQVSCSSSDSDQESSSRDEDLEEDEAEGDAAAETQWLQQGTPGAPMAVSLPQGLPVQVGPHAHAHFEESAMLMPTRSEIQQSMAVQQSMASQHSMASQQPQMHHHRSPSAPGKVAFQDLRAVQMSADSMASLAGSSKSGVRSKQHRIGDTFQRARERLQALQEVGDSELFHKKSWWRDFKMANKQRCQSFAQFFKIWSTSIQSVEGKHGSNVSLTLYFLRFAVLLNCLLLALWLVFATIPFMLNPPPTFHWRIFQEYSAKQLFQGYGLDDTFFLYGGYNYDIQGPRHIFHADLCFPIAIGLMYLLSLLALLYIINQRLAGIGDGAFVGKNQLFPFSTVVFTSWDYHLTDPDAAFNLRNSIRNQLKEMVNDAVLANEYVTKTDKFLAILRKAFGLVILWPFIVGTTAIATFFIIRNQQQINTYLSTGFGINIALSAMNIAIPMFVHGMVLFEGWHPQHRTNVETAKLFTIKMINLVTLGYQLYQIHHTATSSEGADINALPICGLYDTCAQGLVCCDSNCAAINNEPLLAGRCVAGCEENIIGMILYRLVLTNAVAINVADFLLALVYKILGWPYEYDAPTVCIQIIENQAIVWLGTMFAPLLPLFGLVANICTFYFKKLSALWLYSPPSKRYSASRTSIVAYALMLLALVMCTVPIVFNLEWPRTRCGPNQGSSMKDAIVFAVKTGPGVVKDILQWLINPIVLGSVSIFLAFVLMISRSQRAKYLRETVKLREEFDRYRKEMQAKVLVTRRKSNATSLNSSFVSGSSGASFIQAYTSPKGPSAVQASAGSSSAVQPHFSSGSMSQRVLPARVASARSLATQQALNAQQMQAQLALFQQQQVATAAIQQEEAYQYEPSGSGLGAHVNTQMGPGSFTGLLAGAPSGMNVPLMTAASSSSQFYSQGSMVTGGGGSFTGQQQGLFPGQQEALWKRPWYDYLRLL